MNHLEGTFKCFADLELYYQGWLPEVTPKGVVAVVHGFGEHSGRYPNMVKHLPPRGYAIYASDLRGHGKSPGQRGHIMQWEEYRSDTLIFLTMLKAKHPGIPVFLYGHSMGAMIAMDFILRHPSEQKGAIISSAPIDPQGVGSLLLKMIARLLSRLKPDFAIDLNLDVQGISSIEAVRKAYRDDPLVHGKTSVRWGTESMDMMVWVNARPAEIKTPVFFVHGADDPLNTASGVLAYVDQIVFSDKAVKVYPNNRHEIHNDISADQLFQDVLAWLDAHLEEQINAHK